MVDNKVENKILLCTTNDVPGKKIVKVLGLVSGNTVQSRHIGVDFLAGLKQLIGGEIKGYTKMVQNARHEATQRMIDEAKALGANAILCVRYTSSESMANSSEVFAFGTAVVLK
ncbi:MAG: YbjQ family protein [Candidatus Woesearchaeota archaeon]|jgi:uncharacterized protein YbjQ (UPF0145 family)